MFILPCCFQETEQRKKQQGFLLCMTFDVIQFPRDVFIQVLREIEQLSKNLESKAFFCLQGNFAQTLFFCFVRSYYPSFRFGIFWLTLHSLL